MHCVALGIYENECNDVICNYVRLLNHVHAEQYSETTSRTQRALVVLAMQLVFSCTTIALEYAEDLKVHTFQLNPKCECK
jgi:hypothetical protein